MGLFRSYNDARALGRSPRSIAKRAAYRGAMKMYAGARRDERPVELTRQQQAMFNAIVAVCVLLAILFATWLVFG